MQINRQLGIMLLFFATILVIIFLLNPQYKRFQELRLELGEKQAEFRAKFDYYSEITKIYYTLKSQPESIGKVDDALPSMLDLSALLYFFQRSAGECGLILKDVFLSKVSKSEATGVTDMGFSLDLMGDYPSLKNFIMALERSARLFEITNISFGSGSEGMTTLSTKITQATPQTQIKKETKEEEEEKIEEQKKSSAELQRIYSFNLQVLTHYFPK